MNSKTFDPLSDLDPCQFDVIYAVWESDDMIVKGVPLLKAIVAENSLFRTRFCFLPVKDIVEAEALRVKWEHVLWRR